MLSSSVIHQALKDQGVSHVVGLSDNICRMLFQSLEADDEMEVIPVSREGEAFAIAAGLHVGGQKPVVLIQNTGLLESGDAFRGCSWNMKIPQVMLIGYRGFKTLDLEKKDSVAEFTEPTMKAWRIPYKIMVEDEDVSMIERAFKLAESTSMPAAVLIAETTT
jgi:sulfopyruvate decarboxylase subunit alpha